jgi:hypothetical protein
MSGQFTGPELVASIGGEVSLKQCQMALFYLAKAGRVKRVAFGKYEQVWDGKGREKVTAPQERRPTTTKGKAKREVPPAGEPGPSTLSEKERAYMELRKEILPPKVVED